MSTNEQQQLNPATTGSTEGLAHVLLELLHHVVLRDAAEKPRLRALLTGEEVPDADEANDERGEGEERGDEGSAGGA